MRRCTYFMLAYLLNSVVTVKVKVIMHSDEDSRLEDEELSHTESWDTKKKVEITMLPFLKKSHHDTRHEEKPVDYEEDVQTTEKPKQMHPNEILFPLIYKQSHINSMFKFGDNWYTWSTEKRNDGTKAINYFICYEEPKHCDEVGWERTDALPRCAFQIEALTADDRACINSFGVEARPGNACDGGEQLKVSAIVTSCGPRVKSLWRFVRVGRRPSNVAKPADVNSLICEDEEECFVSIEYRIHHDRITFSLHEPTRGQTFKSALKREIADEEKSSTLEPRQKIGHKDKKDQEVSQKTRKHLKARKVAEGKGIVKDKNESGYTKRRQVKNKIKIREDISDDVSECK